MTFKCSNCGFETIKANEYKAHLMSDTHLKNKQKDNLNLSLNINLNLENGNSRFVSSDTKDNNFSFNIENRNLCEKSNDIKKYLNEWNCKLCQKTCNSKEKYIEHTKGTKHIMKQKELYSKNLSEITPTKNSNMHYPNHNNQITTNLKTNTAYSVTDRLSDNKITPNLKVDTDFSTINRSDDKFMNNESYIYNKTNYLGNEHEKNYIEIIKLGDTDVYTCKICSIYCNSMNCLETHVRGKQHIKNLERKKYSNNIFHDNNTGIHIDNNDCHNLNNENCTEDIKKTNNSVYHKLGDYIKEGIICEQKIGRQMGYVCLACNIFCNAIDAVCDHIIGKKHIKNCSSYFGKNIALKKDQNYLEDNVTDVNNTSCDYDINNKHEDSFNYEFDQTRCVQIFEYCLKQCFGQNIYPEYKEMSSGLAHCTEFVCEIDMCLFGIPSVRGQGKTKKEAKKMACLEACRILDKAGILKKTIPSYLYYSK